VGFRAFRQKMTHAIAVLADGGGELLGMFGRTDSEVSTWVSGLKDSVVVWMTGMLFFFFEFGEDGFVEKTIHV
jgi:hypothetical protein